MNFLEGKKRAFFIGVGGIGMSALARYLLNKGIEVYGYDRTETKLTKKLVSEGMNIHYTDDIEFIPTNIDIVVYTPAIPADHKQKNWFIDNDFTLYKRSELLKEILNESRVIAVAGTHGKTSTSSMLSHILKGSDNEVTCFVGGIMVNYNTNFLYGSSKWVVIEADEYDRSFLRLYPDIAIIQALDPDHLDIYGTGEEMVESYREFTLQIKNGGMLVVPDHVGDMMSKNWLAELEDKNISTTKYGSIKEADKEKTDIDVISLIAKALNTDVVLNYEGREIVLNVPFPGRHNDGNVMGLYKKTNIHIQRNMETI